MRKRWWLLIGGAVVAVIAAGGWTASQRGTKATPVQLAKVSREDLQAKVSANGKVQATKKVDISATIPGQVTHLAVKEGDRVRKGQFLLQIDPINQRAIARSAEASMEALREELASARANLAQAEDDFRRAENNRRAEIISAAEHQRARTALDTTRAAVAATERRILQARAQLEGARDTLAKTEVRAPMDGVVTAKRIEEGEVAVIGVQNQPGTVLLTISDMSVVETELEVDETAIPTVTLGQSAKIRIDAYPNKVFEGEVTEVGSSPLLRTASADQSIKFKVKVQIRNPPDDIKPGLSVQAEILTGFAEKALSVPLQALVVRDAEKKEGETGPAKEEEGVFVVTDGKASFKPITTGLVGEMAIEAKTGLDEGAQIITGPFRALRELKDGDPVREEAKKAGGAAGNERT